MKQLSIRATPRLIQRGHKTTLIKNKNKKKKEKRKKVNQPILTTLIKIPNTLTWKLQKIRYNKNKSNTAFTLIKLSFSNLYCTFCRFIMLYIKRERGLICKWSMIYQFIYLCIVWMPTWKLSYMDYLIFRFLWLYNTHIWVALVQGN